MTAASVSVSSELPTTSLEEGQKYLRRALDRGQIVNIQFGPYVGDYVYAGKGCVIDQPGNEHWFEAAQSGIFKRCEVYSGGERKSDRWLYVMDSDSFMDDVVAAVHKQCRPDQWELMVVSPAMNWTVGADRHDRKHVDNPNQIVWTKADMERRYEMAPDPDHEAPRPSRSPR